MKLGDVVQWRSINKKSKYVIKTGVISSIRKETLIVKSGRKTFELSPSAIL